jgi:hypothetical protein
MISSLGIVGNIKPLLQMAQTLVVGRRGLRQGGLYEVRRSRTARR